MSSEMYEDKATGNDVVVAVVEKINDSGIFFGDNGILKRIAYVESKFGEDPNTFRKGYYGGIWQIDELGAFNEITKHSDRHQKLHRVVIPAIKDKFDIDVKNVKYEQLLKPFYSGLFARMALAIVPSAIPSRSDIKAQGEYWKKHYNTGAGKGSVDKLVKDVEEMEKKY